MQPLLINNLIGHRGASAYAPENTLSAFELAKALGCRCIEFDVMLSQDGIPFVFHDESLSRTSNGTGELGLVQSHYLQSLDVGSWFSSRFKNESILRFETAVDWLIANEMMANIEIKPYPLQTLATTTTLLSILKERWPVETEKPLLSSFDYEALVLCQQYAPQFPRGLLFHEWDEQWLNKAQAIQPYSIHFNYPLLTAKRVNRVKAAGFRVFAYTINRQRLARKLIQWGVDALFSDYPDLLS